MKATAHADQPVAQNDARVRRYRAALPGTVDWNAVHAAVQQALSGLAGSLPSGINAKGGCSRSPGFFFSFLACENTASPEIDPVIVGVNLHRSARKILVCGDISGEETGDVLYEAEDLTVAEISTESVVKVARLVALALGPQTAIVVNALRDHSRSPRD
jgi:hypothetical protein